MSLADEPCACGPDTPAVDDAEQRRLLAQLPAWRVVNGRLTRAWELPDFASGLDLVNRIGALAEAANHHPDVFLAWGKVRVALWTHAIGGLSRADFVLAARIDRLGA